MATRRNFLDRLAWSRLAPVWLVLLCLASYLPGLFTIPPIDRDEARFAQASRQMFESVALPLAQRDPRLHSGGLAVPYVGATPRLNKPPLVYWMQTASVAILTRGDPHRDAIWMYRVPNALCTIGAVLLLFWLGSGMPRIGRSAAFLAAGGFAACPLVVVDAHQARADQLLLLTVIASQMLLWRIVSARDSASLRLVIAFWLCMAMGVLAKGPITPMVAALTALTFSVLRGKWRWMLRLRVIVGLFVLIIGVSPWVIAVGQQVGFATYLSEVYSETIGRSREAMEGHWGPPGYHALLALFLIWPLALGAPFAWERARRLLRADAMSPRWSRLRTAARRDVSAAFLLAWLLPSWVVFELVSTKLPHYTMPLLPAAALLLARGLVVADRLGPRRVRGLFLHWKRFWAGTGLVVLGTIALLGGSMDWWRDLGWIQGPGWEPSPLALVMAITLGVPALTLVFLAGRAAGQRRVVGAVLGGIGGLVLGYWTLFQLVGSSALTLSTRVMGQFPPGSAPRLVGYDEDSMVFLSRGRSERGGMGATRVAEEPAVLSLRLIERDELIVPSDAVLVRGFNIARGRSETVVVVPAKDAAR